MKHAFLIIAHDNYPVLETLLYMLDDSRNDVYLHIDKRSKDLYERVSAFRMKEAGFCLLSDRMEVYWGGISQVEVEYLLFETARRNAPYLYYHLLSGVDLPIKSQDCIHDFFGKNQGCEFVGFWTGEAHQRDLERKVHRYYFFTKYFRDKKHPLHGVTVFLRNIALAFQKLLHVHRDRTYDFRKGWNWVSITEDFCKYLVQKKDVVLERFRYTLCPDEIFLQTVLWNSSFRKNIYSLDSPEKGSMRMIDWQKGSPYVWQAADLEELLSSDAMFARKFSSSCMDLLHAIRSSCSPLKS